ncbi:MAG: glycosyltransferase [Syntrophomonadaceae bacterium]|jgi:glycosyltransferase involved in cell wall biosynthesis
MEIKVTKTKPINLVFGNGVKPRGRIESNFTIKNSFKNEIEGVSIITCTNRPDYRDRIIQNYMRQYYGPVELIIVLNHNSISLSEWQKWAGSYPNVKVYQLDQAVTLGECLNYGVQQARYKYVAKFDDDDYYAAGYLQQAVDTIKETKADIVGKCSIFVYFEGSSTLAIAHPGQEDRFTSMLAGATMVINKAVFNHVKFKPLDYGEDTEFQRNCTQYGIKMYSTNRFNYTCIRRARIDTHTWQVEENEYMRFCQVVGHMDDFTNAITSY